MTTADDAFDKLMSKNALNIPVANPSAEAERKAREQRSPTSARPANPREREPGAVRVMNILDAVGDYNPHGDDEENGNVFTSPTETDLDIVPDADTDAEVEEAHRHGARILGRDADPAEFLAGIADITGENGGDEAEFRDVDVHDGDVTGDHEADTEDAGARHDPGLDRARQVRRFAYLPLGEMESFESRARDIMASLVSQDPDKPSLALASATRGDGQTEIAVRLALAVAKRVDYRILLVDFDVRKPQIAPRLGLSSKYFTVTDALRGSCPLGEALTFSEEDNLYVLPARASDRDGDEILSDKQVRQLMLQLHSTFDFVILCCGPLDHADAVIPCRHAGATALAAFCRRSRASAIAEAADRLAESGVTVAGLLLTGAE